MDFQRSSSCVIVFVVLVLSRPSLISAGDIVHQDDVAPKKPGCENNFVLVKVPTWVNGVQDSELVGVGARFGPTLESKEKHANQIRVALADPPDCCSAPNNKLTGEIILVHRGNCSFTTKANIAEAAGASALLIINYRTELYKMVCEANETDISIGIPTVMLPQDAGVSLEDSLKNNSIVSVQLYSPRRPAVDIAEVFLWLMAVGTILCASYWSAWSAREAAIEQDKLLKDASDDFLPMEGTGSSSVVYVNTASAVLFVVVASCFLVMLYKLMSSWFIEILVVLFCIGGVEGLQTCWVALLSCFRWFEHAGESYVKVPFFGAVSYLTLAVSPFCIAFAVVWAVYRHDSFAWIGQDILHLPIHLVSEAKLAGPVHYRWNYFVERNLRTLKSYVRNKSRPEGSIAEGYLAEECLTFCSRYLNEIETKFNRPGRNYDRCNTQLDINLSAFRQSGRFLGKPMHRQLCQKELEQTRLYVLQNCDEVIPYIEEHQQLVQSEVLHKEQFIDWFEQRVTKMYNEGSDKVSQELLSLARGPDRNARSFKGYIVNGFRFHTMEREAQRKTQNSGVKVAGYISNEAGASSAESIEYYGVLKDVVALQYLGGHQIVLFKCDWWDIFRKGIGIYKDKQGFTSVNFSKTIATNEPFVLACQAEQVFYVKDNIRKGWQIVVKTHPRDFYNMPPHVDDEYQLVDDNEDPFQQSECCNLDVPVDDVEDQDKWARDDIDDIIVPN